MEHTDIAEKPMQEINEEIDAESRVYELGYLITPTLAEGEIPRVTAALKALVEENGGALVSEQTPQHMTLAYAMYRALDGKKEKFETAYFGGIKFNIEPSAIVSLKKSLDTDVRILRYIIFKTVRENTRAEIKLPQIKTERKMGITHRPLLRKKEESAPISEEALDRSIKELMVE
ncbi:30S ribosomal protein S6 [Candidatus Kaiserbacteria bacterium]|nr:30S ribosomal protein S6 [Candidatus Kaiserbacteria bacterium]